MKSRVTLRSSLPKPFPKLMKSTIDEQIVLFSTPRSGVVVSTKDINFVGRHYNMWVMDHFEDFDGEVTLSND